jgi:hypothetical protein
MSLNTSDNKSHSAASANSRSDRLEHHLALRISASALSFASTAPGIRASKCCATVRTSSRISRSRDGVRGLAVVDADVLFRTSSINVSMDALISARSILLRTYTESGSQSTELKATLNK